MDNKISLQEGLKASYKSKADAQKDYSKYGYQFDGNLSNNESRVYYRPDDNDLIVSYRGTKNLSRDLNSDLHILTGTLKTTQRYKDSKKVLNQAKDKYHTNATIIGHSLGGSLASAVNNDKKDTVKTLDKGATFFLDKTKMNETNYRWAGDLISVLSKKQKTLGKIIINPLKAHNINNLKKLKYNIFV